MTREICAVALRLVGRCSAVAAVGVWGYQIAERGWGEKNGEPVFVWRKSADVALQALHRLPGQ